MVSLRASLGLLVLISTVALVILFGSISLYWIRRETTRALSGELEKRGLHVGRGLAVQAVDGILLEDRVLLKRLVEETRSLDEEIAYIFLVGPRGELVTHTFGDGFPMGLLVANQLPQSRDYMVRRIVDRGGREEAMWDVVVPIAGGYAGFVHVGLREGPIMNRVRYLERSVTGMVAAFVVLGLLASVLFTKTISRPLQNLAAVSRKLNLETLEGAEESLARPLTARPWAVRLETEVDRLREDFRGMVDRLSVAYRELKKTQEQLVFAERLSITGTIAAGLAHELSNPLAGLSNCLRRIERKPEDRLQLLQYMALMQASTQRMQRVVQGLLDLARPRRPELKVVALEPLLDRVIFLTSHRLTEAGIAFREEIHAGATVVWGDEYQLEQALLNLVLNACDSLECRLSKEPGFHPQLTLSAARRQGRFCVEVRDNGVGIEPENLPRLFEPFFTTKAPGEGTGLGLSIMRNIVRAHGGDVEVESEPGAGATFRILLNITKSQPDSDETSAG